MQFDQQPRVFLLLADDNDPTIQIAREILESPLGLARDVVCRLFGGDFQSLREDLDIVKGFAAGITRAAAMRDYRLADYYTLMFAFHQWFHSSYRARQGKVLEELLKRVLPQCTSFQVLETNQAQTLLQQVFPQAVNRGKWPRSDIDVIGATADQKRLLLVQLRSRDDPGGTTAKGSLADALKELIRGGGSPSAHVLYLIGIWDVRESQQRISTINKIRLPVKAPADQALYLRDLLFLAAIYEKYCPSSGEQGTLVARDRGVHSWGYQLPLFSDIPSVPLVGGEPHLVSFRALAPEITDTNYLTHGLFYYPAKFIPQVPQFCLKEYTVQGDWVIDPFAGSATVGLEAVLMGRNALLLDLNPLLNHIVPLKILFRYDAEPETLRRMLDEMRHAAKSSEQEAPIFLPDLANITYWYDPDVLSLLSRYWGWLKAQDDSPYIRIIELALLKASKYFSYAEHRTPKLFKSKAKRAEMQNLLQGDWKTRLDDLIYTTALDAGNRLNHLARQLRYQSGEVIYRGGVDSSNPEAFGDFRRILSKPSSLLPLTCRLRSTSARLNWISAGWAIPKSRFGGFPVWKSPTGKPRD